jgi:hypothetical protein
VVPVPASSGVLPPEVSVVAPEDAPGVPDIDEKKIYIYISISSFASVLIDVCHFP